MKGQSSQELGLEIGKKQRKKDIFAILLHTQYKHTQALSCMFLHSINRKSAQDYDCES